MAFKRAYKKKAMKSKRVARKGKVAPMETATIKETLNLNNLQANQAYGAEAYLSMFDRALDIADNYQEYRITKLEYKYTPLFDTYTYTGAGTPGTSLPYLYSKVLTVPSPATFGVEFLKVMGAKPRRLDDKTLTVSFKPVVNQLNAAANANAGGVRGIKSPWISTHIPNGTTMDDTIHGHHAFWIDANYTGATNPVICEIELTATFEFRKPWDAKASVPPQGTAPAIMLTKRVSE